MNENELLDGAGSEWMHDPIVFCREAMGWDGIKGPTPTSQQLQLLEAVRKMACAKLKYKDVIEGNLAKSSLTDDDWYYIKKQGISVMSGKGCHAAGTEILMWDGSIKRVEEIEVGDVLIGDDSTPRLVTSLVCGTGEKFYRISYRGGGHYDVNENHVLSLQCGGKKNGDALGDVIDVTVKDFLTWNKTRQQRFFLYKVGVKHWASLDLLIPPYILGVWLGDGTTGRADITNTGKEVLDEVRSYAESLRLHLQRSDDRHNRVSSGSAKGETGKASFERNKMLSRIRQLGLDNGKFIPREYLVANEHDRLELLAGLLDADGCADQRKPGSFQYEFIQRRKNVAVQTQFLARSLGFHCTFKEVCKSWTWNGEKKWGTYYLLGISRGDLARIPCRVVRRKAPKTNCKALRFQFKIEDQPAQKFYGFSLTGNGRFLGADFTVLHNTGKGSILSVLIAWFLYMFDRCKSPITGPSFDQVKKGLMAEFHKVLTWKDKVTGLPISLLHDAFEIQRDLIFLKSVGGKSRFFAVRTAPPDADEEKQKSVLDGWHEEAVMAVIDEGAGVGDGVHKSFVTTLTSPFNFMVLAFNPTRNEGFAYDTHFGPQAESFIQLHWDSRESELVTEVQLEAMERAFGKGGPEYRINVLGLPPIDDPDSLIPPSWVYRAICRHRADDGTVWADYPKIAALDPARGGSAESALLIRQGKRVTYVEGKNEPDSSKLGDWALQMISDHDIEELWIDTIGIGGPIYDYMRRKTKKVRSCDVAQEAISGRFYRLRDELWWKLRKEFETDTMQIPDDAKLRNELGAIKQAKPTAKGKTRVETKEEMKSRGVASPNRGDALMMTMMAHDDVLLEAKRERDEYEDGDDGHNNQVSWRGR